MPQMTVPTPLLSGEKVALVAPCSPVAPERLEYAAGFIGSLGYEPVIFPSCTSRSGFLAGEDGLRASDLNRAFADPDIRAVVTVRGGYGGARLAGLLDYDTITANPKIFCGFSDATVLHILIGQRTGLVTFHAPMPGAANFPEDRFTQRALADVLRGNWYGQPDNDGFPLECVNEGTAVGRLTGGNLTIIASTAGTPYQTDCQDKILFLEDVGEYAYAIDRSLLQLRDSGILEGSRGIILGTWKDCLAPRDISIEETLRRALEPLEIPIISGLRCGHSVPSTALPMGLCAEMRAGADGCFINIKKE